jgi:anti-sigma B factor antagonist
MPAKQFEATVRHRPDTAVIALHGQIDGSAQEALNTAYAEAESKNPAVILLNFTDVSYINSTGIALIVGLLARARAAKRRMLACGLSDHYLEIFTITRLADFVHVFPDEQTALTEAGKSSS